MTNPDRPWVFLPMTRELARQIQDWWYPAPYAQYNLEPGEVTLAELLGGTYYVTLDAAGRAAGFLCLGSAARIPTREAGAYAMEAVDIGLGRRPDLCGQGSGGAFFAGVLAFVRQKHPGCFLRLTVDQSNARACRVYEGQGFQPVRALTHLRSGKLFWMMLEKE